MKKIAYLPLLAIMFALVFTDPQVASAAPTEVYVTGGEQGYIFTHKIIEHKLHIFFRDHAEGPIQLFVVDKEKVVTHDVDVNASHTDFYEIDLKSLEEDHFYVLLVVSGNRTFKRRFWYSGDE